MRNFWKVTLIVVAASAVTLLSLGAVAAVAARGGAGLTMPWAAQHVTTMPGGGQGMMPGGQTVMGGGQGMMNGQGGWSALNGVTPVATTHVSMTNADAFSPQVITVPVGAVVTWTNTDTDTHTVTLMGGMMRSITVPGGASTSVTFTTPGVYEYRCMLHTNMLGRVIVTQP